MKMIKNMKNPYSTLTNLTYILLGWLALNESPVMGSLMIGLGVASTGFHWTRSDNWHKADIVAIYYVFATVGMWLWIGGGVGVMVGLALGMVAHWSFKEYSRYGQHIIGVLGLLTIIPYFMQNGWKATLFVLMWFVLAFICGRLAMFLDPHENTKIYDSLHAIWHIFSGIGIYYLVI